MAVINYKGKVTPYVVFKFKGGTVSGSKAGNDAKNYLYPLVNKAAVEFTITGKTGKKSHKLTAIKSKKVKIFDPKYLSYNTKPIAGKKLNSLLESNSTKWKIDLKISYFPFFYNMLATMTIADHSNYTNLANPSNTTRQAVLNSLNYNYSSAKKKVRVKYKTESKFIRNISLTLEDKKIMPVSGKSPIIVLQFTLDLSEEIKNKKQKDAMLKLIAADYTRLLDKNLKKAPKNSPRLKLAEIWRINIAIYLINHTDFDRGKRLLANVYQRSMKLTANQISYKLRNDIDKYLITANHWGQRRERWKGKERYQRILSDAFGAIDQSQPWASPVMFLRKIGKFLSQQLYKGDQLPPLEHAILTIQYGVANCGDHAQVSYAILREMAYDGKSELEDVINTGQSNVDHQFVVYGLKLAEFIKTTVQSKYNTSQNPVTGKRFKVGDSTKVWDLKETLENNRWLKKKGYIMDPYLDPAEIPRTADKLLNVINSKKKGKKQTHYLVYFSKYPDFPKTYSGRTEKSVTNV